MKVTLANFPSPGQKVEFIYRGLPVRATVLAVRLNIVELSVTIDSCAERWVKPWGWLLDRDAVFIQPSLVELGK